MTLCDALGQHTTLLPVVNSELAHTGWRCAGCAAQAGTDGLLGPPNGPHCFGCGGPIPQAGPIFIVKAGAFCSEYCVALELDSCR